MSLLPTAPPLPVVVTGAGGFVGRCLVAQLLQQGFAVRAVHRPGPAQDPVPEHQTAGLLRLEHPGLDAPDAAARWAPLLQGAIAVVHCAGLAHAPPGDAAFRRRLRRINVQGTLTLARAAAAAGVARMVHISSIKAVGEWSAPGQPLDEQTPPRPEDCYGLAKLAAERGLQRLHRLQQRSGQGPGAMDIVVLRPPLMYGPGVRANLATLLGAVQRGLPLPLGRLDSNRRSLLHVGNLCDAIVTVLRALPANGAAAPGLHVYHLADSEGVSTRELVLRMAAAAGRPARLLPLPAPLLQWGAQMLGRAATVRRLTGSLQVDASAFRRDFDWHPPHDLDAGLRAALGLHQAEAIIRDA